MKVSTNSWHYRFIRGMGFYPPGNLCAYFWKVVWCCAISASGVVAATVLVALYAYCVEFALISLIMQLLGYPAGDLFVTFVGCVFMAIPICGFSFHIYVTWADKQPAKPYRPPSLLSEYVSAKHRKICPLLDFE